MIGEFCMITSREFCFFVFLSFFLLYLRRGRSLLFCCCYAVLGSILAAALLSVSYHLVDLIK